MMQLSRRSFNASLLGSLTAYGLIEGVVERFEGLLDLAEIHHPSRLRANRPRHMHLDAVRMPVQTAALVTGRDVRESVRRLERELAKDLHVSPLHGIPRSLWVWIDSRHHGCSMQ